MRTAIRLIDAAANRAIEAARVLEDLARFCVDDAECTGGYKSIRHELVTALAALPVGAREANRDLVGDVGTTLEGSHESSRANLSEVARANASRLVEALRSLEEGSKVFSPAVLEASAFERLRYRAYTLNATLTLRLASSEARQWRVCVLLTTSMCKRPWVEVLGAALAAGADCIQVREKHMTTAELVAHTRAVVEIVRNTGRSGAEGVPASVIVNDRLDVALAATADGVHLGADDLAIADARAIAGSALLIGATAHCATEARAAIHAGADSCGVGPMFASQVKPGLAPSGVQWMAEFASLWPRVPHLAIGGITPVNAPQLRDAGCRGVAVCDAVCSASDPGAVVAGLCEVFA